jgi:hypothetical protein
MKLWRTIRLATFQVVADREIIEVCHYIRVSNDLDDLPVAATAAASIALEEGLVGWKNEVLARLEAGCFKTVELNQRGYIFAWV